MERSGRLKHLNPSDGSNRVQSILAVSQPEKDFYLIRYMRKRKFACKAMKSELG